MRNICSCSGRLTHPAQRPRAQHSQGPPNPCNPPPTSGAPLFLLNRGVLTKLISVSCRSSSCSLSSMEHSGTEGPGEPLGKQKGETCKAVFRTELSISRISRAALLHPANGNIRAQRRLRGRFNTEAHPARSVLGQAPKTPPRKPSLLVDVTADTRNEDLLSSQAAAPPYRSLQAPHQHRNGLG